jgi:hypothetical protein
MWDVAGMRLRVLAAAIVVVVACLGTVGASPALASGGWSAVTVDPSGEFRSVSCPSASFCAALEWPKKALTYNGRSWSAPVTTKLAAVGLSCPSAAFCVAVGEAPAEAVTYNGRSWSAPISMGAGELALHAVSCPSVSFCVAVGYEQKLTFNEDKIEGVALTYNGRSWSAPVSVN